MSAARQEKAFRTFLKRVWTQDVRPLLSDRRARQRAKTARWGGRVAATGGLLLDGLFRLKGRPFTRAMTVMGSTMGALLPDAWDWSWLRSATTEERGVVDERLRVRADGLEIREALALFDLSPTDSAAALRTAWHDLAARSHPDGARDDDDRQERRLRFQTYQAAHTILKQAHEDGRLPAKA